MTWRGRCLSCVMFTLDVMIDLLGLLPDDRFFLDFRSQRSVVFTVVDPRVIPMPLPPRFRCSIKQLGSRTLQRRGGSPRQRGMVSVSLCLASS